MSETTDQAPVPITGHERQHPAYRLLARAAIALARLRLRTATPEPAPVTTPSSAPRTEDDHV